MEKFYLEEPSIKRKYEIIDYINEFAFYHSDLNGIGALDQILEGYTFLEALERCLNMRYEKDMIFIRLVYLCDLCDNISNIRLNTEEHSQYRLIYNWQELQDGMVVPFLKDL